MGINSSPSTGTLRTTLTLVVVEGGEEDIADGQSIKKKATQKQPGLITVDTEKCHVRIQLIDLLWPLFYLDYPA